MRIAADYLSKELKTIIRIEGFDLSLRHGLVIEGISALDREQATLFSARKLAVQPGKFSYGKRKINVRKVLIEKGEFCLLIHKGDSILNLQHILDHFASTDTTPPADTSSSKPWDLTVSSVILSDMHFMMFDENEVPEAQGMDYNNLDVSDINLEINDISFEKYSIHATITNLSARERCGIEIKKLSGKFQVGERFLKAKELRIITANSDLSLDFDFLYDGWNAYNDFLNAVLIRARIRPSGLDMSDVGYFAPDLLSMKDKITLSGYIRGTISNFKARDLDISFGETTRFAGNINMLGLPDIYETFADVNIRRLETNVADIANFRLPGNAAPIKLPDFLARAGTISLTGKFTGFYNDFVATASINSSLGRITTDLSLIRQKNEKILAYKGKLGVQSLDLGQLTGDPGQFGTITCNSELNGKGFTIDDADLSANLRIDSVKWNGYVYHDISLNGNLLEKKFSGNIGINDRNLRMSFDGVIDMSDSIPEMNFKSVIESAQLFNLNLLQRDSNSNLSANLEVNLKGSNADNLDGSLSVTDAVYSEGEQVITMASLDLITRQDTASGKSYHLTSDFLDADITGDFSFSALIPSLSAFIRDYLASFTLSDSLSAEYEFAEPQKMNLKVRFKNTGEVTSLFLPFLKISENAVISGVYDDQKSVFRLKGDADTVSIAGIEMEGWYFDAETRKENLSLTTGARHTYLVRKTKTDSLEIKLDSVLLISDLRSDSIVYNLHWLNQKKPNLIGGYVSFFNDPSIELKLTDFDVYLDGRYWSVDPANRVVIDTSAISVSKLGFLSEEQHLRIDGKITEISTDSLIVDFNKVDISKIDQLLGLQGLDFDGILQGRANISDIYKNPAVITDLRINKFRFNKELLGDANFRIRYDNDASKLNVNSEIIYYGNVGTNIPFSLVGSLSLDEVPSLNLDLKLKNLNLKMFGPFVDDFMSGIHGLASGDVKIRGNINKPLVYGNLQLIRTEFKINYLNAPYSFADNVTIDTNAIVFDNITLFDSLGHKAQLNGKITHDHFSNLALDLHVAMDDFCAFNNTMAQNNLFYGQARANGTASITGPVENIRIDVKATNGNKTHISIPIDMTQSVGQADYIIFVEPEQDSVLRIVKPREVNTSGISIDLGLRVNENAEVEVFFPGQLGNLKASGTGDLLMTMTPTTPFSLSGNYKLTKGFFLFQLKNYLRLPMSLVQGSSISWAGDPADASISISAMYKTKAPMKGLTTDPNLEGTRIPVECIIHLKGKLLNPDIGFSIRLPNAEESIKNLVYSAIDTNNPVTMADQSIYLLVLNQFKPVVNSANSTVDVSGTAMSLVTNQLNSMISQLSTNVSVNMNYKPGTSTTSQEFDVGISTQLFDDRLLIDGTFGMNTSSATTQQTSTIVGDINIEYILTKNRRWRVRAFNRTNTMTDLTNNAPYTQGVGIKYQRDFSTFRELFGIKKKIK